MPRGTPRRGKKRKRNISAEKKYTSPRIVARSSQDVPWSGRGGASYSAAARYSSPVRANNVPFDYPEDQWGRQCSPRTFDQNTFSSIGRDDDPMTMEDVYNLRDQYADAIRDEDPNHRIKTHLLDITGAKVGPDGAVDINFSELDNRTLRNLQRFYRELEYGCPDVGMWRGETFEYK